MFRGTQLRIAAALALAFCLASGWHGWAGATVKQQRAGREPSVTAPGARVQQARTAHAMRTPVYSFEAGGPSLDVELPVAGLALDVDVRCPQAGQVARARGRSPPHKS